MQTIYVTVIAFSTLITDTQWDVTGTTDTVAKIDTSNGNLRYKEHVKNGYKLIAILLGSIVFMYLVLHRFYALDYGILAVFIGLQTVCFLLNPVYAMKRTYMEIEYSPIKITGTCILVNISQMLFVFLDIPYGTILGRMLGSVLMFIAMNKIFDKRYTYDENGIVIQRKLRSGGY